MPHIRPIPDVVSRQLFQHTTTQAINTGIPHLREIKMLPPQYQCRQGARHSRQIAACHRLRDQPAIDGGKNSFQRIWHSPSIRCGIIICQQTAHGVFRRLTTARPARYTIGQCSQHPLDCRNRFPDLDKRTKILVTLPWPRCRRVSHPIHGLLTQTRAPATEAAPQVVRQRRLTILNPNNDNNARPANRTNPV